MTCVICKGAEPTPGATTATFERGPTTVVVTGVPARVCPQCREAYFDETTAQRLLELVNDATRRAVRMEILEYPGVTAAPRAAGGSSIRS